MDRRIDYGRDIASVSKAQKAKITAKIAKKKKNDADTDFKKRVNDALLQYMKALKIQDIPEWMSVAAQRGEEKMNLCQVRFSTSKQNYGYIYTPSCARCDNESEGDEARMCLPYAHQCTDELTVPGRTPTSKIFKEALAQLRAEIAKLIEKHYDSVFVEVRYCTSLAFNIRLLWGDEYPKRTLLSKPDGFKKVISEAGGGVNLEYVYIPWE